MKVILFLHIKEKYYNMIAEGKKTHEYRIVKGFWNKRLSKNFTHIAFLSGYPCNNKPYLLCKKEKIDVLRFKELPEYAREEFVDFETSLFFDISFIFIIPV